MSDNAADYWLIQSSDVSGSVSEWLSTQVSESDQCVTASVTDYWLVTGLGRVSDNTQQ